MERSILCAPAGWNLIQCEIERALNVVDEIDQIETLFTIFIVSSRLTEFFFNSIKHEGESLKSHQKAENLAKFAM